MIFVEPNGPCHGHETDSGFVLLLHHFYVFIFIFWYAPKFSPRRACCFSAIKLAHYSTEFSVPLRWHSWSELPIVIISLQLPWQCPRAFALTFHSNLEPDPFSTSQPNPHFLTLSSLSLFKHPKILLVKVIVCSIFFLYFLWLVLLAFYSHCPLAHWFLFGSAFEN